MNLGEIVKKAFIETLSEVGFIDVVVQNNRTCEDLTDPIIVKLTILLPFKGDVFVAFSKSLARKYTENIFSEVKEEITDEDIKDSVSEFLNIFAGRIYQLYNPNLLFELGLPVITSMSEICQKDKAEVIYFADPEEDMVCLFHKLVETDQKI